MIKEMKSYEKIEQYDTEITEALAENYKVIIENLGEDVTREGLEKTPERVAKAMQYLTHGYGLDPLEILKSAMFTEDHQQMIVVKDIEVYSMCEHHMLPFFGKAHVAYIPNGKIVGLSKIPRVVDAFARRMQVQERLTDQIKNCIQDALNPLGVAVVIEAQHMCMQMAVEMLGRKTRRRREGSQLRADFTLDLGQVQLAEIAFADQRGNARKLA